MRNKGVIGLADSKFSYGEAESFGFDLKQDYLGPLRKFSEPVRTWYRSTAVLHEFLDRNASFHHLLPNMQLHAVYFHLSTTSASHSALASNTQRTQECHPMQNKENL